MCIVSSDVVIARAISASAIWGAGLKKWMPHTWSGRCVAIASSMIGNVDVLLARTVPGAQIRSNSVNRSFFVVRSSTTASSTRSHAASSPRSLTARTRATMSLAASASSRPRSTCFATDRSRPPTAACAASLVRLRSTTSSPALAATSATPDPMWPEPTMPSCFTVIGGGYPRGNYPWPLRTGEDTPR